MYGILVAHDGKRMIPIGRELIKCVTFISINAPIYVHEP